MQLGLNKILQTIYEQDFLNLSYGFRPGRNCHDALKALNRKIEYRRTNYIVDAVIRSFFTKVNHERLMEFLGARIADPNIQRLIRHFLKAGVMEQGRWEPTEARTPQCSNVSPILANLYLHYALGLWFEVARKKACRGEARMIRYVDDYVCCFQYKVDAERFYEALIKRLAKFDLETAEGMTKILECGRFTEENRKRKAHGKPKKRLFSWVLLIIAAGAARESSE